MEEPREALGVELEGAPQGREQTLVGAAAGVRDRAG
jgi:hypothetical protein